MSAKIKLIPWTMKLNKINVAIWMKLLFPKCFPSADKTHERERNKESFSF
jgi:hypothetical protein